MAFTLIQHLSRKKVQEKFQSIPLKANKIVDHKHAQCNTYLFLVSDTALFSIHQQQYEVERNCMSGHSH